MSIEDAVRAMIEGDARVKLPMCYETLGFPFFDRLAECCRILERRYDSALEYESGDSHENARRQFEAMKVIRRNAELYREDLNNLADSGTPGFSPAPWALQGEEGAHPDRGLVNRSFLMPWAYNAHGVDIHGFHARQKQALDGSPREDLSLAGQNEQDLKAWAQKNLLSGERLWQLMVGDQAKPLPQYSEGQILFLSIASLLDILLTKEHGDWCKIITDKTAKTSVGYFIKSRLNVTLLVGAVSAQLPIDIDGKDPAKTIEGHIKSTVAFWLHGPEFILDYSAKAMPKGYRTLYGLARAAWNILSGQAPPDKRAVKYPATLRESLSKGLTAKAPLTAVALEGCLEHALNITTGLYPSAPGDLP